MHTAEAAVLSHYQADYFNSYQKPMGAFGGIANKFLFEAYINATDTVLDFGCGGGFLLKNLPGKKKFGVEINSVARDYCTAINGIDCYPDLTYINDASVDVIISCHCLEHTTQPYQLVSQLYDKLRPGGRIIIVVPLDSYKLFWKPHDVNNHLYSFSPMNLGNMLHAVGFQKIVTQPILQRWPPFYEKIYNTFGLKLFHRISNLYGMLWSKRCVQVRGVGLK